MATTHPDLPLESLIGARVRASDALYVEGSGKARDDGYDGPGAWGKDDPGRYLSPRVRRVAHISRQYGAWAIEQPNGSVYCGSLGQVLEYGKRWHLRN